MAMKSLQASRYPDSVNPHSIDQSRAFEEFVAKTLRGNMAAPEALRSLTLCPDSKTDQFRYGDALEGVEIKLDNLCTSTGRLSVEVAERTALNRPWHRSGINADSAATWYIQGNFERFWVFHRSELQAMYTGCVVTNGTIIDNRPATIKKFYLPIRQASIWCLYEFSL